MTRTPLWIGLAVVATIAAFAAGYWQGIGRGGEIISTITAQNEVSRATGDIRTSLDLLEKQDLAAYRQADENRLHSALHHIGANRATIEPIGPCSEREQLIMRDARAHLEAHPLDKNDPLYDFMEKGAAYCAHP